MSDVRSIRAVTTVACALALAPVVDPRPAGAQPIGGVHEVSEIAEGVFVASPRFGSANATIVELDDGVLVVDTHSTPGGARALLAEVEALTGEPVRYVVSTHWHGDHHGGNRAIAEAWPEATFLGHPATREEIGTTATAELRGSSPWRMRSVEAAEAVLDAGAHADGDSLTQPQRDQIRAYADDVRRFVDEVGTYTYLPPAVTAATALTVHDGSRSIEVRHPGRPAHTRGDVYVWLPEERILIAGDLLTVPYVVPRSGYPRPYARVLREMAAIDFRVLVPGHGPVQRDARLLLEMAEFLEAAVAYVEAARSRGWSEARALENAASDPALGAFEERIEWDTPGGLRFLDFEGLVEMTVGRAWLESAGSGGGVPG